MQLYAIKTRRIKPGDNVATIILDALKKMDIGIDEGDVLALASKAVATAADRIVNLKNVKPSEKARRTAENFHLQPEFVELVLREADKIFGGVEKALLTLKNGNFHVNSGIDNKNAPEGHVVLLPENPHKKAEEIRRKIESSTGKRIGVIIVDSGVHPLRMGTRGFAIGVSGFKPLKDYRNSKDLFQKQIYVTRHAIADDLASAAHFLMGEADEQIPAVLIKNAGVELIDEDCSGEMRISSKDCVFTSAFNLEEAKFL